MKHNKYYKAEGNMLFGSAETDNLSMLTWGPFYYHNKENVKKCLPHIKQDIINWVNGQDPTLNIQPENEIMNKSETLITFNIKAWKTESELENTKCLITVE